MKRLCEQTVSDHSSLSIVMILAESDELVKTLSGGVFSVGVFLQLVIQLKKGEHTSNPPRCMASLLYLHGIL